MGARAEVLVYLWTHEWAHGRLIAERAAYNQAVVADYLSALAEARLADHRPDGRRTLYRLTGALRSAAGDTPPMYVDWVRAWPALTALLAALDPGDVTDDAIWLRVARVLVEQAAGLGTEGLDVHVPDLAGWARSGSEPLVEVVEAVVTAVQGLAG
ncbi:MAG: hypothetical protein FDZ70_09535 [Actinobacteria bacterium]|nr:MAG: hypothetical protein FDZ70_09535 [Actinomycetota bacterium]